MSNKINISIPKPCHENWNLMTPEERGRFCSICQKTVHDFTKATDRQIIEAYTKDKKLCGRFLVTQLDRDLVEAKERKSIWLASLFLGLLTISSSKVVAQEKPKVEQTPMEPEMMGKMIAVKDTIIVKEITGIVRDENGPIPGVNVYIKGSKIGVSTDFNGKYSIKAKEGDILVFSFMGMNDVVKKVGNSNIINTILTENNSKYLGEVVICRKRTFFSRTFLRIGNWFR